MEEFLIVRPVTSMLIDLRRHIVAQSEKIGHFSSAHLPISHDTLHNVPQHCSRRHFTANPTGIFISKILLLAVKYTRRHLQHSETSSVASNQQKCVSQDLFNSWKSCCSVEPRLHRVSRLFLKSAMNSRILWGVGFSLGVFKSPPATLQTRQRGNFIDVVK